MGFVSSRPYASKTMLLSSNRVSTGTASTNSGHTWQGSTRVPSRLNQLSYRASQSLVYPLTDWRRRLAQRSQPQEIINQKELRVVGMRRTGNHAIITWIERQQPGTAYHLNNVAAGTNPYRYKSNNLRRYHPQHGKMAAVYQRQAEGNLIKRDCLILSYEDWGLEQVTQPRFERNRTLYLGKSAQQRDVLILRDPFNLFASRLKQNFVDTKSKTASMVDMWLAYAREFTGESSYLQPDRVCINYNRWFADVSYRRELADQLGLVFSDAGLRYVPPLGGGSSFSGTRHSGQAGCLDVTNRWRHFADNPAFRQLFQNEEIWHYSQQIFGDLPETETLRPAS